MRPVFILSRRHSPKNVYDPSLSKSPPLESLKDESEIKVFVFFLPFQPLIGHLVLKDIDDDLGWRTQQKERAE